MDPKNEIICNEHERIEKSISEDVYETVSANIINELVLNVESEIIFNNSLTYGKSSDYSGAAVDTFSDNLASNQAISEEATSSENNLENLSNQIESSEIQIIESCDNEINNYTNQFKLDQILQDENEIFFEKNTNVDQASGSLKPSLNDQIVFENVSTVESSSQDFLNPDHVQESQNNQILNEAIAVEQTSSDLECQQESKDSSVEVNSRNESESAVPVQMKIETVDDFPTINAPDSSEIVDSLIKNSNEIQDMQSFLTDFVQESPQEILISNNVPEIVQHNENILTENISANNDHDIQQSQQETLNYEETVSFDSNYVENIERTVSYETQSTNQDFSQVHVETVSNASNAQNLDEIDQSNQIEALNETTTEEIPKSDVSYQNLNTVEYNFSDSAIYNENVSINQTEQVAFSQIIPCRMNNQNVYLQIVSDPTINNSNIINTTQQENFTQQNIILDNDSQTIGQTTADNITYYINIPSIKTQQGIKEEMKLSVDEYVKKLKECHIDFDICKEICPLIGYRTLNNELFLIFQGAQTQYFVLPNDLHEKTSIKLAEIIHDDKADYKGQVIKIRLSEEVFSDNEQNEKMDTSINDNNVKTINNKQVTQVKPVNNANQISKQYKRPNIVRINNLRNLIQQGKIIRRKPLQLTTIEVLEDDASDMFDDEEFFKVAEKDESQKSNNISSSTSSKSISNRSPPRKAVCIPFSSTPKPKPSVPLNTLTSSVRTYARTFGSPISSEVRSGTIQSTNILPKKIIFSDNLLVNGKRKLTNEKYRAVFYCRDCEGSFFYLNAFKIHREWCCKIHLNSIKSSVKNDKEPMIVDVSIKNDKEVKEYTEKHPSNSDNESMDFDNNKDEDDDDDDDDEDKSLISSEDDKTQLNGFHENDLVWVPVSNSLWPAFIMKLWVVEQKVEVQLIHSNLRKTSWKVPVSCLQNFDLGVKNMKRKNLKDENLFRAFQASEQYLKKRVLDENVNPYVFFNTSKISSSPIKNDLKVYNIDYRKIIALIKQGKVETHLINVYKETIDCERQKKWKNNENNNENIIGFGPVKDEELQDELRTYCTNLFVKTFGNECIEDLMLYLMNVWIPEAIVRGISRCYNIDPKEAETYFP